MRRSFIVFVIALATISPSVAGEIFCKHFLHGQPNSTVPNDNDLVIRDCYALSNNAKTKFADWVAFRLTPQEERRSADRHPPPQLLVQQIVRLRRNSVDGCNPLAAGREKIT